MAPNVFFLQCKQHRDVQIDHLLKIMVCRAAYGATKCYDDERMPKVIEEELALSFDNAPKTYARHDVLSHRQVLQKLKVNFFSKDGVTKDIEAIQQVAPTKKSINTYIMTLCSSRKFIEAFSASGACSVVAGVRQKFLITWAHMAKDGGTMCESFTRSYNPQRRQRALYATYNDEEKAQEHFLSTISTKQFRLRLKDGGQQRYGKRQVCRKIRKLKGIGVFLSKNYWQFYCLGRSGKALPDDLQWSETGPGARVGANVMAGRPPNLLRDAQSLDSSDFFVQELVAIRKRMRLSSVLKPSVCDNKVVQQAKLDVLKEIVTLEGVQFFLCEWSKIVKYVLTRDKRYERIYYEQCGQQKVADASSDDECSSAVSELTEGEDEET
jgi:hypothetical protein